MLNPKIPLHDAVKEEKGCRVARGKSWMDQAERLIQHVCGLAELKQVRDWGKFPAEFKSYYKTLLSENLGTHCCEWPAGKANGEVQKLCRSQQQATWHRDLHRRISHKGPVWLGVHGQAGWKDCARRQWSPQSHDLQPGHGSRSSHICNTVASLQAWDTDYTCHYSHRLNEPAAKGGVWNGLPRLAHSHVQSSATKTSVDLLSWARRSQWEWTGR